MRSEKTVALIFEGVRAKMQTPVAGGLSACVRSIPRSGWHTWGEQTWNARLSSFCETGKNEGEGL